MSKITLGICSDWLNGNGILSCLTTNFDVPWKNVIDGQVLDDDYYGNRSGNKIIAPLVEKFVDENGLSDASMLRLARVIYAKYGSNWQKTYDALLEEYNPIWNVDGTETIIVDGGKRKKTFTKGRQQNDETYGQYSETINKNGVTDTISDKAHTDDIVSGARNRTTKSQIEGFNSSDFSDANREIVDETQVTDQNKYGLHETENIQGERTNEYGQKINNFIDGQRVDTDEDDAYRDTTTNVRQGNIGVTSTQNLLTQEMEFRLAYSLMDSIVFPDVDKVMCLNIFGCEDLTVDDFTIITDYVLPVASASRLGGVKIGNGITIAGDGTISVQMNGYVTQEQLTEAIQNFITQDNLTTTLASYATTTALTNGLANKQDTLVSGTNIKTVNGNNLLGGGDITIQEGGSGGNAYDKDKTVILFNKYITFDSSYSYAPQINTSTNAITYRVDISEFAGKWLRGYAFQNKTVGINRCRVAVTTVDLETVTRDENGKGLQNNSSYSTSYPNYTTLNMNVLGNNPVDSACNSVNCSYHLPENAKYMYFYIYTSTTTVETSVDDFECNIMVI